MNFLNNYLSEINRLCEIHKVKVLYAFGSVLSSSFNDKSDIDFAVEFKEMKLIDYADNYFDLKFSLQNLFNRTVDLIELEAVKNPFFKRAIEERNLVVYGE